MSLYESRKILEENKLDDIDKVLEDDPIKEKDINILYEDDEYLIVNPYTLKSICLYGNETQFCSDDGRELLKNNQLIYIINKSIDLLEYIGVISKNSILTPIIYFNSVGYKIPKQLLNQDETINKFIKIIDLWREEQNTNLPSDNEFVNMSLKALSNYIQDPIIHHYKKEIDEPWYTYNNGKIIKKFYVGNKNEILIDTHSRIKSEILQNPSEIYEYNEFFPTVIENSKLIDFIIKRLGFNGFYSNNDVLTRTMEEYSELKPNKLKLDKLNDNTGSFIRIRSIEQEKEELNKTLSILQKKLSKSANYIKIMDYKLNELGRKLDILKIRDKELNDINLKEKIKNIEGLLGKAWEEDQHNLDSMKVDQDNVKKIKDKLIELDNEYSMLLSQIEDNNLNELNYEYSKDQIKQTKIKIESDVLSNSLIWINKMITNPVDLLRFVKVDKLVDKILDIPVNEIGDLFGLKLLAELNMDNEIYYIFE
jgi:hypothetical protein